MQTTRANMKNIGKAEFMALFHQYQNESLCSKKLNSYLNQVQDPSMKNIMSQMSTQCQERANRLSQFLQESGGGNLLG